MKKLNIFLMMALALGFASCEPEWVEPTPQTNPQEELFTAEDLVVTSELPEAMNLDVEDTQVAVAKFNSVSNLPTGATVEFAMFMAKDDTYANAVEVTVTNVDSVAYTTIADLQTAYTAVQGRNPQAKDVFVQYAAYVVNGTEKVRVNGLNTFYAPAKVNMTPVHPGFVMEEAYYLVWGDDAENLNLETAYKFNHSDKDVYDDTNFSIVVDITPEQVENGFWWMVVPQSTIDAGEISGEAGSAYGVFEGEEESTSGALISFGREDETCSVPVTFEPGKYQFSINMYYANEAQEGEVYREFAITPAFDNLWTPGNSNGWNHDNSNMLATNDYITYSGFAYLNGDFKFSNSNDWNHTNYGKTDDEGVLSTDGGAGNLSSGAAGLFWCSVNIPNLEYAITKIETIGLIGGFNGWAQSLPLTETITGAKDIKYTGTFEVASVENGGNEFKFRANDDWAINLGGTVDNLTNGGDNLKVEEVGTYEVVLDLSNLPYTCTITKK